MRSVVLCIVFACMAACGPAGEKQRQEEAINRGEAAPGAAAIPPSDSFAADCTSSGGVWNATAQQCAVTQAMCSNVGEWRDGIGCVLPSVDANGCSGVGGLGMVGDACVITYATRKFATQI